MDKSELEKRAKLAPERAKNLFKRYPMVGALVVLVSVLVGMLIGWLVF